MMYPSFQSDVYTAFTLWQSSLVVDVKDEVDKCVGVVHPTHHEDNIPMIVRHAQSASLDDGRDEDGEREDKVGRRLRFRIVQLSLGDLSIPKCP